MKEAMVVKIYGQGNLIRSYITLVLFMFMVLYFCITVKSNVVFEMFGNEEEANARNPFKEKIVHFDLKGAPPTLTYYEKIFPLLKQMKVNAILMEYEDMFPYWNELNILRRTISYNSTLLKAILKLASNNNLEVIPLLQTFGHMEFVLKHSKYSMYREDLLRHDTICPSDKGAWNLITEMLEQMRIMHPDARRIHIGADEAYSVGKDERCLRRLAVNLNSSVDRLKLEHITRISNYARNTLGFTEVLVWNDMFGDINADLLNEYKMGELVIPVIWGYAVDVTKLDYFPRDMFKRYSQVFPKMMFASAFKGANGQNESFCYIKRYLANQQSYVDLYRKETENLKGKISGIILTGWQRYDHYSPLCEILPVSIPSLVIDLIYLNDVELSENEIIQKAKDILNCQTTEQNLDIATINSEKSDKVIVPLEMMFTNCSFPGSEIYDAMANLHQNVAWKKQLSVDAEEMRKNIALLLQPYFDDESVKEIIEMQLS